jgi:hypothetical protein
MDARLAFTLAAELRDTGQQVASLMQELLKDDDPLLQHFAQIYHDKLNRIAQQLQYEPPSIFLRRWPHDDAPPEAHYAVLMQRMQERLRGP